MEETFKFELTKQTMPIIEFNYEQLKAEIKMFAEKRKDMAVTEDNLPESKKIQKELASVRNKVDDARKKVKKQMSAPIKEAEEKFKELIAMIKEVEDPLKNDLAVFVEQERQEKKQRVLGFIESTYKKYYLDEKYQNVEVTDRHLLKSTTIKAIKEDIDAKVLVQLELQNKEESDKRIAAEELEKQKTFIINQVAQANENFDTKLKAKDYIDKLINGSDPLQIGADISTDVQKILEDREDQERRKHAEARAAAEETRRQAELEASLEKDEPDPEEPHVEVPGVVANPKDYPAHDPKTGEILEEVVAKVEIEKPIFKYEFIFKITETYDRLALLSEFLKENNLEFEELDFKEVN